MGTVYYRQKDDRWVATVSLGGGNRRSKYARTREDAEAHLQALLREAEPVIVRHPLRDVPRGPSLRPRARSFVLKLLRQAIEEDWDEPYLAQVIVASLAPRRVSANVFGPCHYCGNWTANTVDHVMPRSRGGKTAGNVVSCCSPCNLAKSKRTVEEWRAKTA